MDMPREAPDHTVPPGDGGHTPPHGPSDVTAPSPQSDAHEQQFRLTAERAPIGMAHVAPDGRLLWVNAWLCDLLGYTRDDLLARAFHDITYPADLELDRQMVEQLLSGEPPSATVEQRCVCNDGSLTWVQLTGSVVRDAAGAPLYFIAVFEDIDERKRGQDEMQAMQALSDVALSHLSLDALLRELLARIASVMHVDNVAILLLPEPGTAAAAGPDRDVLTVRAVCGLEEEVAPGVRVPLGKGFAGRIAASREPLVVDDMRNFDVMNPFLRLTLRSAAGVPLVSEYDRVFGVLHVGSAAPRHFRESEVRLLQRVADRVALAIDRARLYEQARQFAHERDLHANRLEVTFEAMMDGVMVIDRDGRILHANHAFRRIWAVDDRPDFFSRPLPERGAAIALRDVEGRALPYEQWPSSRVLRGEEVSPGHANDVLVRVLSGEQKVLSVTGAPIHDDDGQLAGGVLVFRDVTEWRQAEAERAHMLGMVAHELRTPLTSMKTYAQVIQRRLQRAGITAEAELLGKVEADIAVVNRLVEDLLDATRLETGKLELTPVRFDLRSLAEERIDDLRRTRGREIQLDAPDVPVEVYADPTRVAQVLSNLLTNALKYSAPDRPVTVTLSAERERTAQRAGRPAGKGASSPGVARVAVRDEGPGIPPDALGHLFERFYRVPGMRPHSGSGVGLGLGLYIAKTLIDRQGGSMAVESTPGQGSVFSFTLPLAPRDD